MLLPIENLNKEQMRFIKKVYIDIDTANYKSTLYNAHAGEWLDVHEVDGRFYCGNYYKYRIFSDSVTGNGLNCFYKKYSNYPKKKIT